MGRWLHISKKNCYYFISASLTTGLSDVFYLFEPLHGFMRFPRWEIDDMETMNFLKGVLRCKFTYAKCPTRFRYKSNALSASPLCTRDTSSNKPAKARGKLTPRNIQNVCKSNCNLTVVKNLQEYPKTRSSHCFLFAARPPARLHTW